MSCFKNHRESKAFIICFHQDNYLPAVVKDVTNCLHKSDQVSILSLQPDGIHIYTEIQDEKWVLDKAEESDLNRLQSGHDYNILAKDGKLYIVSKEHEDKIHKIKVKILERQEEKFFRFEYDDSFQKDPSNRIRRECLRRSSHYNDIAVKRKFTVRNSSLYSNSSDDNIANKWLAVKRKRKTQSKQIHVTSKKETAWKRKYSKLVTIRVRTLSNQDSDCPISSSSMERETETPENAKEAKVYIAQAACRKRKVTEDAKLQETTVRGKASRKDISTISGRSKSLENRRPYSVGHENVGKQNSYREYEDKNSVVNYLGKENDALSLKTGKQKDHEDDTSPYSSWLRERTNLPFNERPVPLQVIHVYPLGGKKKKRGSNTTSGSQRQDTDRAPVQVTDQDREPSLPPREQIVTSTVSVYRQNQFQQFPPPTCNVMTYAHEQTLILRLHGLSNRSRHGRAPPPAKHPQYSDTAARRASYNHWPRETRQDPNTMANYGFFHTGRADLVRCFQCGIGLKDWSEPDEPLFEHIKHSPVCAFLLRLLGPELLAAYKVNLVPGSAQPTAARPPPVEGSSDGETMGATGGAPPASSVRSPQYSDLSARLRSFDSNWSRNMSQSPLEVAEAGFYYSGEGDVCRCFTCDGGLTRWDPQDDPWVEHAKWFPQCAFVRQVKGEEYVNLIQQAIASSEDEDTTRRAEAGMATLTVSSPPDPMTTTAAQGALETGYSRNAVSLAIHELIANGKTDHSATDIVEVLVAKQERGEALPTDSPSNFPPNTERAEPLDDKETLERDNTRLKNILKCMRCDERFTNILFIPCTHHRMCEECAADVTMCPVCGRTIEKKVKTYMS